MDLFEEITRALCSKASVSLSKPVQHLTSEIKKHTHQLASFEKDKSMESNIVQTSSSTFNLPTEKGTFTDASIIAMHGFCYFQTF